MKNLDPKELAVNHGEKLVILVCAVILLLTILSLMGGVVSGGRVGSRVEDKIDRLKGMLKSKVATPRKPQDIIRIVKTTTEPLPDSDEWDTGSPAVAGVVGEVKVIVGQIGEALYVAEAPDVEGLLKPKFVSAGVGHGYVFTGAQVNQQHLAEWRMGLRTADQIEVIDQARDMQWAVLYGWFDLRDIVDSFDRLLAPLESVLEERARTEEGRRPLGELPRERPGERPVPGAVPSVEERPEGPLWMPQFRGFLVEREDLERPGEWVKLEVPPPAVYELRQQGLPRPAGVREDRVWPPPIESLWEGGRDGFRSILRQDPLPEIPGRIRSPDPPPGVFQPGRPGSNKKNDPFSPSSRCQEGGHGAGRPQGSQVCCKKGNDRAGQGCRSSASAHHGFGIPCDHFKENLG